MATITGLTAARMEAIEAASVVDGDVVGDNLILTKQDGSTINAGNVRGATGATGPTTLSGTYAARPAASVALNGQRYIATDKYMEWECISASWVLVSVTAPEVNSLPASPIDQQECIYVVDATNGIKWHLKYRSASASAYKWEYIGGAPLISEVLSSESTASGTYVNLTTTGPSVALPLAGDYIVEAGCFAKNTVSGQELYMSYAIGGTGASDADRVATSSPSINRESTAYRKMKKTGLTAVTLTAKYRTGGGTATFEFRWMTATPIRVG